MLAASSNCGAGWRSCMSCATADGEAASGSSAVFGEEASGSRLRVDK